PLLQLAFEGLALDELHRQEGAAVGQGAQVVHRGDAGVLQLPGDARLVQEAPRDAGVVVEALQDLDGHLAVEDRVGGAVDDAHAAAGDFIEQDVAPTRWHVAGRGRQVRRSNGGGVRRYRRRRLLRQVGLWHRAQRWSLAILSSEAGRCKPLLVAADRLLDLLELQRLLVQQRRFVLALVLPRRDVAVMLVVALRLAVGILILLPEV